MRFILAALLALSAGAAFADWTEPPRGSATRAAVMDALRPYAEGMLGAPVEFVVSELRQSGDLAFAMVDPQRPGGGVIAIVDTPAYDRGQLDPLYDHLGIQALFRRVDGSWQVRDWALGATDVWFISPRLCAEFGPVIEDFCAYGQ